MYYTIYKITNKINDKEYIGAHQTLDLDDGYMGSGKYIKRAIKKYGIENFKKEYLCFAKNEASMYFIEAMLVDEEYVDSDISYNLQTGGKSNGILSNESKQKISASLKEYYKHNTPNQREYLPITTETKYKISKSLIEFHKNNPGIFVGRIPWNKGLTSTQSAWNKGIKTGELSEEIKSKISSSLRERYLTIEHNRKGKEPWNKGVTGAQVAWNKGIKSKTKYCKHCGRDIDVGNYVRWHGDNCKMKKI